MFRVKSEGNYDDTERFLTQASKFSVLDIFKKYGEIGARALASATPVDSGVTANSWTYEIENTKINPAIHWYNTNVNNNVQIAVILQYGHGTGTGGYVQGRDYIKPAIRPIFDKISKDIQDEVNRL